MATSNLFDARDDRCRQDGGGVPLGGVDGDIGPTTSAPNGRHERRICRCRSFQGCPRPISLWYDFNNIWKYLLSASFYITYRTLHAFCDTVNCSVVPLRWHFLYYCNIISVLSCAAIFFRFHDRSADCRWAPSIAIDSIERRKKCRITFYRTAGSRFWGLNFSDYVYAD